MFSFPNPTRLALVYARESCAESAWWLSDGRGKIFTYLHPVSSLIAQIAVVIMRCLVQHRVLIVLITVYPNQIFISCILTVAIKML